MAVFLETVEALVAAHDMIGLDALAETALTAEEKEVLAEAGYLSIASEVEYSCRDPRGGAWRRVLLGARHGASVSGPGDRDG